MSIIVILITISLTIAIVFLAIFYWNMKSGQYDDTYTPSVRILFDNKPIAPKAPKQDPDKRSPPGEKTAGCPGDQPVS
jgi:cbb3-type cytochrome oxidase maturation protein